MVLSDIGPPILSAQVNSDRAACDGDVFRHIPRQRHRAAVRRCRVDGCLQGGVLLSVILRRQICTAGALFVVTIGLIKVVVFRRCRVAAHAALRAVGQPIGVGGAGQGVIFCLGRAAGARPGVGICIGMCPAVILVALRSFGLAAQLALRRVLVAVICVFPVMLKALLKGRAARVGGLLHFSGRCSYSAQRTDVRRRQLTASGRLPVKVQRAAFRNIHIIADRQRCLVAQDQIDLAGNIERGDREILFYYIPARCRDVIGTIRDLRAVCLCLHRAICVHIGKLVCGALRDGGIAHHAFVAVAVCGLLAAFVLIAVAVVQQGRRCAVGVPDAASVRYIGDIAAAGKLHLAFVGRHRVFSDPQRVGAITADRAAADVQRSVFDVYALFSGERAAQNIRRAAAGQKYRAVLVHNNGARSAFIGRCDLNRNTALHRQGAAYIDRLTAVGLHDLTAVAAVLNGQAAAVFDVKYSVQRDKAALPTGRLDHAAVQVQSNIAAFQTDAVAIIVIVFGDRHIRQQLH